MFKKFDTKKYTVAPSFNKYLGDCFIIAYSINKKDRYCLTDNQVIIFIKVFKKRWRYEQEYLFSENDFHKNKKIPLRISSSCITSLLGDNSCNCNIENIKFLKIIKKERNGVFIYLPQEGFSQGLRFKLRDHQFQFGIDAKKGKKIKPLNFKQSLRKIYGNSDHDIRSYIFLKTVFKELGLSRLPYRYLGTNLNKREKIIKETGLNIS